MQSQAKPKGSWGGPRPGFGGKQPGSGRPKGGLGKRAQTIRAISDEAINAGVLPIEILLKYMRFYDEKAHAIYVELENKMEEIRGAPLEDATVKLLSDAVDHLEKLDAIMTRAQAFAVDAASFVHQRLANVQVTGDGGGPVRIAVDSIAPEDRRRMYYEEMRAIKAGRAPTIVLEDLSKKAGRDEKS